MKYLWSIVWISKLLILVELISLSNRQFIFWPYRSQCSLTFSRVQGLRMLLISFERDITGLIWCKLAQFWTIYNLRKFALQTLWITVGLTRTQLLNCSTVLKRCLDVKCIVGGFMSSHLRVRTFLSCSQWCEGGSVMLHSLNQLGYMVGL